MGAQAYRVIEQLSIDWTNGCIVELGSESGEGSTQYLSEFSKQVPVPFYTVDPDPGAYSRAKSICGDGAFKSTGEEFLASQFSSFGTVIKFLYLDNFDWMWDAQDQGTVSAYERQYAENGLVLSNENSQKAHKAQVIAALPFMGPGSFVLFDDTFYNARWDGKGGLAVPALISAGFSVIERGSIHALFYRW
jgi:hypothetical protein